MGARIIHGDCLEVLKGMETDSVDLVLCSPPYEDCRLYGELGFKISGQEWVDWAKERYVECCRVSKGLVAWVIEGKTKQFRWSATPALLMADLHRAGIRLRKPPIYHRVGIPGSGGPEWLRNDYEFIVCASKGRLPWADNTACGHPPKYCVGGAMSYRQQTGERINKVKQKAQQEGISARQAARELGEVFHTASSGITKGDTETKAAYIPPERANPGNVIKVAVGGGLMGSKLAHENEAPYPESLCDFFVKSFCPPGGTVLDPFGGSGTTMASALKHGRNAISIDTRESQVALMHRRLEEVENENRND